MVRQWKMIDLDTGEVKGDFYPDLQIVRSKKQDEAYKRKLQRQQEGRQHEFTFSDMEQMKEVISMLDEKTCGYLLYLQCFVNFDNVLVKGQSKTPMTKKDIQETLKIGKSAFAEFFKKVTKASVLLANEDGTFSINSRYHFRGKTQNERVIKSFTSKVKELYGQVNSKDLGFLYLLLPYVHYETNILCSNPFERNVEKIEPLSQLELSEIVGSDDRTTYRKIKKLQFDGMFVLAEVRCGKEKHYKLNPFVFYRKDGYPDTSLRADFLVKRKK